MWTSWILNRVQKNITEETRQLSEEPCDFRHQTLLTEVKLQVYTRVIVGKETQIHRQTDSTTVSKRDVWGHEQRAASIRDAHVLQHNLGFESQSWLLAVKRSKCKSIDWRSKAHGCPQHGQKLTHTYLTCRKKKSRDTLFALCLHSTVSMNIVHFETGRRKVFIHFYITKKNVNKNELF